MSAATGTAPAPPGWLVERTSGPASAFHARDLPDPIRRTAWVLDVDRPALVLGSAQADGVADRRACEAAGVEVARRRSGGGAVLLDPGQVLWVDLLVPRDDPLWDDDIGRAALWVGQAWAAALARVAPSGRPEVHGGALVRSPWSATACFAGMGPGEVRWRGAKVVGVSQRRTRAGARFQTACLLGWDPSRLASLLALDLGDRIHLVSALARAARPVPVAGPPLLDALLAELPR